MRAIVVVFLVVLSTVAAVSVDSSNYGQKQKDIYRLFKHINQPSYYKDHVEIANSYKFYDNAKFYKKSEVVDEFYEYYQNGYYLKKGEIFSVFYEDHLKQAIALFKLFYYASDYDTFYKTAVWARNYVNEGLFIYSFSVALVHRPDTYYFVLPPIYEIYPYYFYPSEVIQQAQYYKQLYSGGASQYNDKTIYANYSGYYLNLQPEQSLSYFTEDVGVNSYYYYFNLYYPFWLNSTDFSYNDKRGENFFYFYQQFLARYYLERISNGFGEIQNFNWEAPFTTGYTPSLRYPNGLEFPSRPNYVNLYEYFYNYGQNLNFKNSYGYSYTKVQDYEHRFREAIDRGYVYTHDGGKTDIFSAQGLNILGNLIEGNGDSPYYSYYGSFQTFARHLLGYSYQAYNYHQVYPSALEHFETSLRDPAFYQLYKKLISYFYKYIYTQQPYTSKDLAFPGVTVSKVEFDQLVTYFDYFYSDLSNAVFVTPEEYNQGSFKVQVAQKRLNNKPFSYKIYVNSEQETEAVVKVYLGPKYDEYGRYINLTNNYVNFVQFDHFNYKLKAGQNVISKNYKEIYNYFHDREHYSDLYQKAFGAYSKNQEGFQFYGDQIYYGFPQRFYLPLGSSGGVEYQFYVIVSKAVPYQTHGSEPIVGSGTQYVDGYPFGYPFNRPVAYDYVFYQYNVPNSYFYDVKIYHQDEHQTNTSY